MDPYTFTQRTGNAFLALPRVTVYDCHIPVFSRTFTILHQDDLRQLIFMMGVARVIQTTEKAHELYSALGLDMLPNMGAIAERMSGMRKLKPANGLEYIMTDDSPRSMRLQGARLPEVHSYRDAFLQVLGLHKYDQVSPAEGVTLLDQVLKADLPMDQDIAMKIAIIAGTFDLF